MKEILVLAEHRNGELREITWEMISRGRELAQALGGAAKLDVATLGALGQYFAVAVGGGCVIPWALIPAAAVTGTDPIEVARRNLFPSIMGFIGVVIVAIFML